MTRAIDVAKYIRSRRFLLGEVQLQKLLYYVQAWSLVWDGQPLFRERIEAWKLGPVVPALRHMPEWIGNEDALSAEEQATVDAVLEYYHQTGSDLIGLTHSEGPWQEVWGDRRPNDRCSDEIPHNLMRRYYTAKALRDEGPRRRAGVPATADDDEVLAIAEANALRWSKTLEILAR